MMKPLLRITIILILSLSSCVAKSYEKMTPEEAMSAFAKEANCDWDSKFGIFGPNHDKPSPDLDKAFTMLPTGSFDLVKELGISYLKPQIESIPNLRNFKNLERLHISGNKIKDISSLADLPLVSVGLDDNPIDSLDALSTCTNLRLITASNTLITRIPDFSKLIKLEAFVIIGTPIKSLEGVQTIPGKIKLKVSFCKELTDISALTAGTVERFVVDEEQLQRFKPWLDKHIEEIRKKNPEFEATTFDSGL